MSPSPEADINIADVQAATAMPRGRLRFPPAIEARFEADTAARRCRRLFVASLLGMLFYLASIVGDSRLMPDVFAVALILKLGLVIPLFAATLLLLKRSPPPWLRESVLALTAIVIMAVHMRLMTMSASPLAIYLHVTAPIDIVFANLIVRARFWYALSGSTAAFAIYVAGMAYMPGLAPEAFVSVVNGMLIVLVCTLYANYQLEHDGRRSYLVGLRERLRSDALSRANQELSRISNLDAMTGLANRRGLEQRMQAVWLAAQGAGQSIAVLMLDVDEFKMFNDRYGHQAGDGCLEKVAETLRGQVRGGDALLARYGGEEFIVVLPGTDLLDGIRAGERLRRAIEARGIRHDGTASRVVTASIGIAAAPATPDGSPKDIIESADAALYEAKRRGRNRVWPPMLSPDPVRSKSRRIAEDGPSDIADVA